MRKVVLAVDGPDVHYWKLPQLHNNNQKICKNLNNLYHLDRYLKIYLKDM